MPDKERYWKNPEYYRRETREYNRTHDISRASAQWAENNPDKIQKYKREYYERNKEKIKQKNLERRRALKQRAIIYLGGECNRCGLRHLCADVFCFHHTLPSEKSFSISQKRLSRWDTLQPELDKCELLCANCHRKAHTNMNPIDRYSKYRHRKKQKMVHAFGGKCFDCGLEDLACVYDFHHLDSSKKEFSYRDGRSWSETRNELSKCVMLCSNCHKVRHANKSLQNFSEPILK